MTTNASTFAHFGIQTTPTIPAKSSKAASSPVATGFSSILQNVTSQASKGTAVATGSTGTLTNVAKEATNSANVTTLPSINLGAVVTFGKTNISSYNIEYSKSVGEAWY
jgi:hypothetical protein